MNNNLESLRTAPDDDLVLCLDDSDWERDNNDDDDPFRADNNEDDDGVFDRTCLVGLLSSPESVEGPLLLLFIRFTPFFSLEDNPFPDGPDDDENGDNNIVAFALDT